MRVEVADRALGVALIILGVMQWVGTPFLFRRVEEPAAWFFAGGMLLALVGALSLLRIKYGALAPGVKWVSLAANVMLSLFWLAMVWLLLPKFIRHPAALTAPVLVLASTACALLNPRR